MAMRKVIPDSKLQMRARSQLLARGLRPPCIIKVQVSGGIITLTGTVEYAHQRSAATKAVDNIDGARKVQNELEIAPAKS